MIKRIVSGLFILVALGALGFILAGALSSGEQLIVRFLTAIIVAALALYVISDLRMQANAAKAPAAGGGAFRATTGSTRITEAKNPPAASTAAFMESVTARKAAVEPDHRAETGPARPASGETATVPASTGAAVTAAAEPMTADAAAGAGTADEVVDDERLDLGLVAVAPGGVRDVFGHGDQGMVDNIRITPRETARRTPVSGPTILQGLGRDDDTPYPADDELASWPHRPGEIGRPVEEPLSPTCDGDGELEELVALFARKTERDLERQQAALAFADDDRAVIDDPDITIEAPIFSAKLPAAPHDSGSTGRPTPAGPDPLPVDGPVPAWTGRVAPLLDAGTAPAAEAPTPGVPTADNADPAHTELVARADDTPADHHEDSTDDTPADRDEDGADTPVVDHEDSAETPVVLHTVPGDGGGEADAEPLVAPLPLSARHEVDAATYTHAPIAPIIDLRMARPSDTTDDIEAAIRSGELEVISSLIEQGLLSTEGPISDRDVRTMVYVAFTSNELRKILLAGGVIDGADPDLDLGRVELFPRLAATSSVTPLETAGRISGGFALPADGGYDQPHRQAL